MTLGTLAVVAGQASDQAGLSPADWAAVRFTILQALVSATVSVGLAVPVARALARRKFPGRQAMVTLLGAPFLLPVIVAVIGLVAVFGRNGVVNSAMAWLGWPPVSIFGFHGVVLAHVFFNLPLAVRLILQGWIALPAERFRLAASLNLSVWRVLEWPMLRATVPGVFLAIFLICLTSFAVALTLGGGPRATTVELAIYQALLFDFDLGRAALLACVQFGLCAMGAVIVWHIAPADTMGAGLDRVVQRWDRASALWDHVVIWAVALFLLTPLVLIFVRGVPGLMLLPADIWAAALRSVTVALCSAALCSVMAVALALRGGLVMAVVGVLPLAASGLVIGTGAFLVVYPVINPARLALVMTVLVNATLALPFVLRAIAPQVEAVSRDFGRLGSSLGLSRWAWVRRIVLPRIRRPLGFGAGLAAALSMGDLGVIALFAGAAEATLPLAMYRLMGAYQMTAAAGAAVVLVVVSFALFWLCDRWGRGNADM